MWLNIAQTKKLKNKPSNLGKTCVAVKAKKKIKNHTQQQEQKGNESVLRLAQSKRAEEPKKAKEQDKNDTSKDSQTSVRRSSRLANKNKLKKVHFQD